MDPNKPVRPVTRFFGRTALPFGLVYSAFAVAYFGYYVVSGQFSAFHLIYALFAALTSVFAIVQGLHYRRDPRFR